VLAGVLSFPAARRLDFDRTLNTMFAEDDPLMPPYRKLLRVFGDSEVALAVYEDEQLLSPDKTGIHRLQKIRGALEAIPGITSTMGLDSPIGDAIVDPDNQLSGRLQRLFVDFTHSRDGETACIACIMAPRDEAPIPRDETVRQMREVLANLPDGLAPGILAGEPVMMSDAFKYIEQDGRRLFLVATVLMGLVILIFFRSLRWVIIPMAVVQLSLLMTKAFLYYANIQLTMVSSMLTAIVTVVGVATVVHVIVRFRDARETGMEPLPAMRQAGTLLIGPVFWSCVTDAVGFASLGVASVAPVRNFGTMMAIGSLMVLVSAAMCIGGLALLGRRDMDPKHAWGEGYIEKFLRGLSSLVEKRPVLVGIVAIVFTGVSMVGIGRLETETDFTRNFRSNTEIVKSYEAIESRLGGAGLCDIIVPAPETITWREVHKLLAFEDRLRNEVFVPAPPSTLSGTDSSTDDAEEYREITSFTGEDEDREIPEGKIPGLTKIISLADAIDYGSPVELASVGSRMRRRFIAAAVHSFKENMMDFYSALVGTDPKEPDKHYMRVMLRARERQPSANKRAILAKIHEIKTESYPEAEVTGYFVLLTSLIDSVVRDQWRTFGVAVLGIGAVMIIAFGSLRYALVALIPNCFPILVVSGLMGWLGLKVNMGAAMIAAVSVGLSVDSSIHYIRSYQRERKLHQRVREAISQVQSTVGRAVVFSTLALVLGFVALCTSPLIPTVYFGVLVSISMLGGLAGNLVVLPLLLRAVDRDPRDLRAAASE
jgi:predicted RND superfamily exporter protein